VIWPPTLRACLFSSDSRSFIDHTDQLETGDEYFDIFQPSPLPGDALYFGYNENLGAHVLDLAVNCRLQGIGVDPRDPPLAWEAWCGDVRGWTRASIERDETGGLNQPGTITLRLPMGMEPSTLGRKTAFWLRVRVLQARPRQPAYSASPRLSTLGATAVGGLAMATHSSNVIGEVLGRSSGVPGQVFSIRNVPVLPRRAGEHIEVQDENGEWHPWSEVPSFRDSSADDGHYTFDGVSGTVAFGPTIRQPDGAERPFGATPPRGQPIRMTRYRMGGGLTGNVGANTLVVLKSAIPYIASVTNPEGASGGLDAESIESARLRAPLALRSQDRAVTAQDYEFLAKEASRHVARAHCIQVRPDESGNTVPPGTVELLVVPVVPPGHARTLTSLQPSPELLADVKRYLDDRRLLGTQLAIDGPAYIGVSVEATIVTSRVYSSEAVRAAAVERIIEYLDPLVGGPMGDGWPFGRDLYLSEIQSVIQAVPGVEYAQDVTLYQVDIQTGQTRASGQKVTLAEDVLLLSYEHTVTVARAPQR
jgi:predicted phage baseplate assembly protein